MRTVGSHCISSVIYGTYREVSELMCVCAAGSLLPFQAGDRWLIGSVSFELMQEQSHSEEAKISLATMPRDKLIKPLKGKPGSWRA